jgi:nucleoside-diphosphate-sugar epimerase
MLGSAEVVAGQCLEHQVEKLIHVGSIAGLFLGDASTTVTGETPPDPQADERADYARGKAATDQMLMDWHSEKGLPVCILRPGVVVGEGSSPFHTGVGFYNNEQHCMGWNGGMNGLPFVLVEDVAEAIVLAAESEKVTGKTYNLIGDVRLTAAEYIQELAQATSRPLKFHGQSTVKLQAVELFKWVIKQIAGRRVPLPSYRDLLSRGMRADAKRDLGWQPVAQRDEFIRRAILVYA